MRYAEACTQKLPWELSSEWTDDYSWFNAPNPMPALIGHHSDRAAASPPMDDTPFVH